MDYFPLGGIANIPEPVGVCEGAGTTGEEAKMSFLS